MKKYTDAYGNTVSVINEVYAVWQELDKKEQLNERRETRRCQSLELSLDNGWDIADTSANTEQIVEKNEEYKRLYKALNKLPNCQRKLIYLVFFKGITQQQIADKEGVSRFAINKRLIRILKNLKKILN